jgi:hypothetical protein
MDTIIQILKNSITRSTSSKEDLFDSFLKECLSFTSEPVHSLAELREKRTTKSKGDFFERFCQLYLKYIKKYDEVWTLKEVPFAVREALSLESHDVGIDLIAKKHGRYSAVQCKYKTPRSDGVVAEAKWIRYNTVNWSELSTFYALCSRTGPWEKHIVMTTAKSIRRMGHKNEKDLSICLGTFKNVTTLDFIAMYSKGEVIITPEKKEEKPKDIPSQEEVRLKRLAFFDKK